MDEILLTTKLHLPYPSQSFLLRPRLAAVLAQSLRRKLTLVSAPAGYGKTTLVSAWLREAEVPSAWLSLDEGDNDRTRFLQYLLTALQRIIPSIQTGWLSAVKETQPNPHEALFNLLINEISESGSPIAIVLDDFQVIEAQAVLEMLTYFLEHMPREAHLLLLTRSDPPLPLSRLRVQDQLVEVRAEQLRFNQEETASYLNEIMKVRLPEDDLQALERRTEGWIAGLQLAAVSMQSAPDRHAFVTSFSGSHYYIMDYLAEEVLRLQPERVRSFLLQTSILERLCGPLCEAVLQPEANLAIDGQGMLEALQGMNLFIIPLDSERRWYRYHHLFADVLRLRLERLYPRLVPDLHRRASDWLEQDGLFFDAIRYSLGAGERERAAQLLDRHGCLLLMGGEVVNLLKWIEALEPAAQAYPWIAIQKGWAQCLAGQLEGAEEVLDSAEKLIDPLEPSDDKGTMSGTVIAARAYRAAMLGKPGMAADLARQALGCLPASSDFSCALRSAATSILGDATWIEGSLKEARDAYLDALQISQIAGNLPMQIITHTNLADITLELGQLNQAARLYGETLKAATSPDGKVSPLAEKAYAGLSRIHYEWNQPEAAAMYAGQCIHLSRHWGSAAVEAVGELCLAKATLLQEDPDEAGKRLRSVEQTLRLCSLFPWQATWTKATLAEAWLRLGRMDTAAEIIHNSGIVTDGLPSAEEVRYLQEPLYLVQARLLMANGDDGDALVLSELLLQKVETRGQLRRMAKILVLQALAYQQRKELPRALAALEKALTLAQAEGYVRVFLDEGKAMAQLLHHARSQRPGSGYAAELLAQVSQAPGTDQPPEQPLLKPLTLRELEVLKLIEGGCSNQEIAAKLFISLPTVKRHISNIYFKLGVESRTQAVSIGRELRLFE